MSVPGEPDSREVAPTELALDNVAAILEGIPDPHGVVAPPAVVLDSLVLGRVIAALAAQVLLLRFHQTPDRIERQLPHNKVPP